MATSEKTEWWFPGPPKHALDGYGVIVCSCDGGPYTACQPSVRRCRCEVCGFITREQLSALQAATLREAADEFPPEAYVMPTSWLAQRADDLDPS